MKSLKHLFLAFALSTTAITTQAIEPPSIPLKKQVAGYYHHQFGPYQITALLDGTNYLDRSLFKGVPEAEVSAILKKYAADQAKGIQTSVNAFLVDDGNKRYLVDSGAASCFGAHLGSIYQNLQAAGYQATQINDVLLTHLHPDHVCGISNNGVANYPNATLHISQQEYNYWMKKSSLKKVPKAQQEKYLATVKKIKAALAPYEKAKKIKLYNSKQRTIDNFNLITSTGHTPGHHGFALEHAGERLIFIGDIVHSHTIQFEQPKTAIDFDIQPEQAVQTRLEHFTEYAKQGYGVAGAHLPFPGIGTIYSQNGQSFQWIPVHFRSADR